MNSHQKIWKTVFGLTALVFFILLIYGSITSEDRGSILQTIGTLDTNKVRNILIAPENPDWKINLTLDTLTINNKSNVSKIIFALKELKEKHLTKGANRFWESTLIINFYKSNTTGLKNNEKLTLKVIDTGEGLFIEMPNAMGYTTYACQQLKPLLETLTNYQNPQGKQN